MVRPYNANTEEWLDRLLDNTNDDREDDEEWQ